MLRIETGPLGSRGAIDATDATPEFASPTTQGLKD
jgi:hypothetical protein